MPTNDNFSLENKRILICGHRGMVGSAIIRRLIEEHCQVLTVDHASVDLSNQGATFSYFESVRPDAVFLAAAKVGGIWANESYPADFLYTNLMIEANVIEASRRVNVSKLLFLGSSCIYPKFAPQPIREDTLLEGALEPTNEWYAIAKISGIKLCQAYRKQFGCNFISAMPTNLYGPGDNYDLNSGHVIPALLRKADTAKRTGSKIFVAWGSGAPEREFLHVDDCADACVFLMKYYSASGHINVGSGKDISIRQLAELISEIVGFSGRIEWDTSKPDGTPKKLMDVTRLKNLGWEARIKLRCGLSSTYDWYCKSVAGAL